MALKGNQKKLDKNNNNRIDSEDFKILRGQGKAAMKAKRGKLVPLKKDPTKAISSVKPSAGGRGSDKTNLGNPRKSGENFMERRLKLGRAGSMLGKAGRIGLLGAALGVAGAGAAKLGQTIGRKMSEKKNKKMGGGMMKKYNKGGGADTGTVGERRSKIGVIMNKAKRLRSMDRLTDRDIDMAKKLVSKKMGGGMMKKPMGYKKGKEIDYGKVFDKKFYSSALGKEAQLHADDYDAGLDRAERRAASETMALMKKNKKMGGGMMMKPMGYKSGTSVKAKCKLGRNKPTKMY